jgi:hypothetical protein
VDGKQHTGRLEMRTTQNGHEIQVIGADLRRWVFGSRQATRMLTRIQQQQFGGSNQNDYMRDLREAVLVDKRVDALLDYQCSDVVRDLQTLYASDQEALRVIDALVWFGWVY